MTSPNDDAELAPGTPWTKSQLSELTSMRTHLDRVRSGTVAPGLTRPPTTPG